MSDRFPDEPSIPEVIDCPHCDGIGSWYGIGPHHHEGVTEDPKTWFGSTRMEPKGSWPNNFAEDEECPGCGIWTCSTCNGNGRIENPIAMLGDEEEEDLEPWPFGETIQLGFDENEEEEGDE